MKGMKPPFDQSSVGRGVGVFLSRTRALSSSMSTRLSRAVSDRPADQADVAVLPSNGGGGAGAPLRLSSWRGRPTTTKAKVRFTNGRVELLSLIEGRRLRNVRESKVVEMLEREDYLTSIAFDNRNFSLDELEVAAVLMLERAAPNGAFADKNGLIMLFDFVSKVRVVYRPNPYHDFRHGIDVMQFMNHLLSREDVAQRVLAPGQGFVASGDELRFMMLVACICHDAAHDGSELVHRFGPESTLERLHSWHAEQLIAGSGILDVLKQSGAEMDATQFLQEVRNLIMATDMEKHAALVSAFRNSPSAQLLNMLIKVSDISNVARNFEEAKVWAKRLEAEMKLATTRFPEATGSAPGATVTLAQSVIGFSKMFALPLIDAFDHAGLQETSRTLRERVEHNIAEWERFSGDSLNPGL
jgi:hypothetical protein